MPPSEAQLGYLAGIIDGEGSITLNRNIGCGSYQPQVRIFNTNSEILESIQRWLGGNVQLHSDFRHGRKPRYRLCWTKQSDILRLLEMVEPFLIAKKSQAQLLMSWIQLRCSPVNLNTEIVTAIQGLNRKGV